MQMADLALLVAMVACALLPMALTAFWMRRGMVGYALTLFSLLGASLAIAFFAGTRDLGVDPLRAISVGLIFLLPALIGCVAGGALGQLVRWRTERPRRRNGGDKSG